MNDLVILGIVLGGGLGATMVGLFIWQHIEHRKSAQELKMFQMENTRIIQQLSKSTQRLSETMEQLSREAAMRHEENMSYFHGIMQSIARIIRKQEEGEGEGAK
jgi:hypothetical protein